MEAQRGKNCHMAVTVGSLRMNMAAEGTMLPMNMLKRMDSALAWEIMVFSCPGRLEVRMKHSQ